MARPIRPKRAKARPSRVILPVAAALLLGGSVAAYQLWPEPGVLGRPLEVTSTGTTTPTASVTPTASAPGSPSPTPTRSRQAETALTDCRAKVRAGDRVIAEATIGIRHWNEHVQAQTDAYARKIDVDQMETIFSRTRRLGPADLKRYDAAVKTDRGLPGSCAAVPGATADVAAGLTACRERAADQKPVLVAATDGMDDWKSHLGDMVRSRHEHVPHAQQVWIDTWRAAPPHLRAWKGALAAYQPPAC